MFIQRCFPRVLLCTSVLALGRIQIHTTDSRKSRCKLKNGSFLPIWIGLVSCTGLVWILIIADSKCVEYIVLGVSLFILSKIRSSFRSSDGLHLLQQREVWFICEFWETWLWTSKHHLSTLRVLLLLRRSSASSHHYSGLRSMTNKLVWRLGIETLPLLHFWEF